MSTYAFFDTVAAVATPFGKGGVAVIRLSGTDAAAVAARLFRPRSGRALTDYPARVAVWGDILSPDEPGRVLDDGLCTLFLAPHSFTGEDVAEISCHGGVLVTRGVLDACLRAGARQALPGEFTRRAFLNGRLSLDEAEALGNLLEAGSDEQLRLSRAGMSGHLARETEAIYGALCPVLANLEAGIDFPEEDLTELTPAELAAAVAEAEGRVCRLLATYRTGHAIAEGIPTAICGAPCVWSMTVRCFRYQTMPAAYIQQTPLPVFFFSDADPKYTSVRRQTYCLPCAPGILWRDNIPHSRSLSRIPRSASTRIPLPVRRWQWLWKFPQCYPYRSSLQAPSPAPNTVLPDPFPDSSFRSVTTGFPTGFFSG
mgnify:CR=1 FL=1